MRVSQEPNPINGSLATPIFTSSTFCQKTPTTLYDIYDYGRGANPTRTVFENVIASLEQGKYGIATSSGLAANCAVMMQIKAGEHVIAVDDTYGGT